MDEFVNAMLVPNAQAFASQTIYARIACLVQVPRLRLANCVWWRAATGAISAGMPRTVFGTGDAGRFEEELVI